MHPLIAWLLMLCAVSASAETPSGEENPQEDTAAGKSLFLMHCARCHGVDGGGGEGSRLTQPTLRHASDDEALVNLIIAGIPGTGMPSIWALDKKQATQVASYVRSLGQMDDEQMPGDPMRGETVYSTLGGCPACHIVSGQGRGFGPELTDIGIRQGLRSLTESLLDPAAAQSQSQGYKDYLTVRATTANGLVEGYRIAEDTFWIHIRDLGGTVHSFRKNELVELKKIPSHSLMPDIAATLPDQDLDDLISYLMSLGKDN